MGAGHLLACFFGGAFLINALPHLVAGTMGRAFQSPFASPPGKGLSSATVNVVWGCANLVMFYWLTFKAAAIDPDRVGDVVVFGLGVLVLGAFLARCFGPLHGGDLRERP
ncbi:MAG: hypothetical protein J7496_12860 [Novosphingobium sp.]|nr:hypothetical protein [Novosphingobium sp.]MBO9603388.1 hypothetical protein [Novosphingobium sp.]